MHGDLRSFLSCPALQRRAITVVGLLVLLLALLVGDSWFPAGIEITPKAGPAAAPMVTGAPVAPPVGFIAFCLSNIDECTTKAGPNGVVVLTDQRRRELEDVQWSVNHSVAPRENPQQLWQYPTDGAGDCNSYTLAKQRALLALGWPRSSLLMAAAWTETHEGHLVLVARTTEGDLVLDNRVPDVVDWGTLPYQWISRQSSDNPTVWLAIENGNPYIGQNSWPVRFDVGGQRRVG